MKRRIQLLAACMIGAALFLTLSSCAGPLVRTDLQTLQEKPEQFEGKQVIVTAGIDDVVAHPEAYKGKKVELTGPVEQKGFWRTPYWSFTIQGEKGSLKCYERIYRVDAWILPVMAIKRAARENSPVTVVGKVEQDLEIELDWIEYQGQHYDTDRPPANMHVPFI